MYCLLFSFLLPSHCGQTSIPEEGMTTVGQDYGRFIDWSISGRVSDNEEGMTTVGGDYSSVIDWFVAWLRSEHLTVVLPINYESDSLRGKVYNEYRYQ